MIVLLDYNVVSVTFIYTTHKSKQINKHAKKKELKEKLTRFFYLRSLKGQMRSSTII